MGIISLNNLFLPFWWSLKGVEEDAQELASQDEYAYETIDEYDSEETREDNQPLNGGKFLAFVLFPFINKFTVVNLRTSSDYNVLFLSISA